MGEPSVGLTSNQLPVTCTSAKDQTTGNKMRMQAVKLVFMAILAVQVAVAPTPFIIGHRNTYRNGRFCRFDFLCISGYCNKNAPDAYWGWRYRDQDGANREIPRYIPTDNRRFRSIRSRFGVCQSRP